MSVFKTLFMNDLPFLMFIYISIKIVEVLGIYLNLSSTMIYTLVAAIAFGACLLNAATGYYTVGTWTTYGEAIIFFAIFFGLVSLGYLVILQSTNFLGVDFPIPYTSIIRDFIASLCSYMIFRTICEVIYYLLK